MKLFSISNLFLLIYITAVLAKSKSSIRVSSPYCEQFKNKTINLDLDSIKGLTNVQYITKDFKKGVPDEVKLDYYIRYFHISRGLCYYENPDDVKEIYKIGKFYDTNQNLIEIRYEKTINCYYMYNKYIIQDTSDELEKPCADIFPKFFNPMLYYLYNETLCPLPKDDSVASLGTREEILNARTQYLEELMEIYNDIKDKNIKCEVPTNEEIFNCGYDTQLQKREYCRYSQESNKECCSYKSLQRRDIEINYKVSLSSIITGVCTALVLLIIGLYFSYFYIENIKTQENIRKSIAEQEKIYQMNSRQQMIDNNNNNGQNSGYYSDTNTNTNSYYSYGFGTNPSQIVPSEHHSLPMVNSTNSQNKPIRSPQPLPNSPQDIANIRLNFDNNNTINSYTTNNDSIYSEEYNTSFTSANYNPRVQSPSSRRSSIDIVNHLGVPVDGPRPLPLPPNSPRYDVPQNPHRTSIPNSRVSIGSSSSNRYDVPGFTPIASSPNGRLSVTSPSNVRYDVLPIPPRTTTPLGSRPISGGLPIPPRTSVPGSPHSPPMLSISTSYISPPMPPRSTSPNSPRSPSSGILPIQRSQSPVSPRSNRSNSPSIPPRSSSPVSPRSSRSNSPSIPPRSPSPVSQRSNSPHIPPRTSIPGSPRANSPIIQSKSNPKIESSEPLETKPNLISEQTISSLEIGPSESSAALLASQESSTAEIEPSADLNSTENPVIPIIVNDVDAENKSDTPKE